MEWGLALPGVCWVWIINWPSIARPNAHDCTKKSFGNLVCSSFWSDSTRDEPLLPTPIIASPWHWRWHRGVVRNDWMVFFRRVFFAGGGGGEGEGEGVGNPHSRLHSLALDMGNWDFRPKSWPKTSYRAFLSHLQAWNIHIEFAKWLQSQSSPVYELNWIWLSMQLPYLSNSSTVSGRFQEVCTHAATGVNASDFTCNDYKLKASLAG